METSVSLVPHSGRAATGSHGNASGTVTDIFPKAPDGPSLAERILANAAAKRAASEPPSIVGSAAVKKADGRVEARREAAASTPSTLRLLMGNV